MDIEILQKLISENLTQHQIAEKLNFSQTNVRYWLNKYNLKTRRVDLINGENKKCPRCSEVKNLEYFYDRRGKEGGSVYCISCSNEETRERNRRFKLKCVDYKGGCCEKCGYKKFVGALQFHHVDPTKKDFALSKSKSWTFSDKTKKELDKCILVCANCHFEIHGEKYLTIGNRNNTLFEVEKLLKKQEAKRTKPSLGRLLKEVVETNYSVVGKKYGVSDNAIRKWIKNYGATPPKKHKPKINIHL